MAHPRVRRTGSAGAEDAAQDLCVQALGDRVS